MSHLIEDALQDVSAFSRLSKADFDRIVARHGVDPDADTLVGSLVEMGWTFCPFDDVYIGPEEPEGWYRLICLGGLDI